MNLNPDEESNKLLFSSSKEPVNDGNDEVSDKVGNESTAVVDEASNNGQVSSSKTSFFQGKIRSGISQSGTSRQKMEVAATRFNFMKKKLNETARAKKDVLKTYMASGAEEIPVDAENVVTENAEKSSVPKEKFNAIVNNEETEQDIQNQIEDDSLQKNYNTFGNNDALSNNTQNKTLHDNQSSSSSSAPTTNNISASTEHEKINVTNPAVILKESDKSEKTTSKRERIRSAFGTGKRITTNLREKASLGAASSAKSSNPSIPPMRKLENGETEYRVKPFYINKEPTYMTEEKMNYDMLKPTKEFFLLQSNIGNTEEPFYLSSGDLLIPISDIWKNPEDGRIGSLSIEILGAVGVRKFDRFSKPNSYANLICGDSQFETDVIHSTNSPIWPSKSKRGAVFPIFHAYARLYLGLFHEVKKEKNNDRFIGRTIVDVSSLRPNSMYDVWLPLKTSSFVYDRKPRGAIHVRFSVHWFDERSVVTSYLSSPKNQKAMSTVSIPCSDPKKFHNMIYTLHGEDLPGKYSPRAFQAVMREFALYKVQLMYQSRHLLKDTMLYERPIISFYLFVSWMHCVYMDSVVYVPPYVIGFLILHLVRNYFLFCSNYSGHSGYKPIYLSEIFNSLAYGCGESGKVCGTWMKPLVMPEPPKENKSCIDCINTDPQNDGHEVDHSEFPFSEKQTYQRRTLQEYLASKSQINIISTNPSSSNQTQTNIISENDSQNKNNEDDNNESPNEEEQRLIFDPNDSDDEDDYDILGHSLKTIIPTVKPGQSFPVGPQQNVDLTSKKPVQVRKLLNSVERSLHAVTGHLFDEEMYYFEDLSQQKDSPLATHNSQVSNDEWKKAQNKYIKRLGVQNKSSNPIVAYSSQFFEPIMSIVKVYLSAVRLMFNVAIWKDPILTFWILIFLIIQLGFFLIFPWRLFFFAIGVICLGPQNYLGRFVFKKSEEENESMINNEVNENKGKSKVDKARNIINRSKFKFARSRTKGNTEETPLLNTSTDTNQPGIDSNILTADLNRKATAACEVLVPYGRSKVDRFYYWPPDPAFSSSKLLTCEDVASMTDDDNNFIFTEANIVS